MTRPGENGCLSSSRACVLPASSFLFYSSSQWIAHPQWGGTSALFSLQIQMLIASGNTPQTPSGRMHYSKLSGAITRTSPVKVTHKMNHHTILFLYFFCSHILHSLRFFFPPTNKLRILSHFNYPFKCQYLSCVLYYLITSFYIFLFYVFTLIK